VSALLLAIAGCVPGFVDPLAEEEIINEPIEHHFDSMVSAAEINYVVPVSIPNILVNQLGYLTDNTKMAIFRGENLPDSFDVVYAATGQVIYSGEIGELVYNAAFDEHLSYGFFDDVTQPGLYYLEAKVVGRSYFFTIGDDLFASILESAARQYYLNRCGVLLSETFAHHFARPACHIEAVALREDTEVFLDVSGGWHLDGDGFRDTFTTASIVTLLLLAHELYDGATDDLIEIPALLDEIRHGVEWLRKMQDVTTGGVYAGVEIIANENDADIKTTSVMPVSVPATKMFCAAMAKFAYLYQGVNNAFATECLRAADRAWRYLERNHTDLQDEIFFLAACEMYRASGFHTYHRVATAYMNSEDFRLLFTEIPTGKSIDTRQETILMGAVTYLLTRRWVDRRLCAELTEVILMLGDDVATRSRLSPYLTTAHEKQSGNTDILTDMFVISITNFIIPNHEYMRIIENHVHYLCGRNSAAISYIDDVGGLNYKDVDNRLGIMNHIETNTKLYFSLMGLRNNLN
jgi:endoglucanase